MVMQPLPLNKLELPPPAAMSMALPLLRLERQMLSLTPASRRVAMRRHCRWRLEKLLPAVFSHVTMRQMQHW
jgi:hypothetical protein